MDNLIAFLRARLDERESFAREAGGRWTLLTVPAWSDADSAGEVDTSDATLIVTPTTSQAAHIADNDPARVLSEVDAKRLIIEWATDDRENGLKHANALIEGEYGSDMDLSGQLLRLLALPYAAHPDYREEWRL